MKKLIFTLMAAVAALTAKADWEYQSFLNPSVTSLCISNDLMGSAGRGYTNLLSVVANGGAGFGTNVAGVMWTNRSQLSTVASNVPGTQIIISNGVYYQFVYLGSNNGAFGYTNAIDWSKYNLFQDVTLWTDKPGSAMMLFNGSLGPTNFYSYGSLFFSIVGQSGANSAVTFRFLPIFGADNTQTTAAGDFIPVTVTANTTTFVNLATNLLAYKAIGAKRLRLVDVVNADADATSSVYLVKVGYCGFRP